jgi:hypothetical protein
MIVTNLCGGLGNQMFQYAFGRRLALDHKTSLWLDISSFKGGEARGETPRNYRLHFFRIKARLLPPWLGALLLPFPRRLPPRFAKMPRWPGLVSKLTEEGMGYNPKALQAGGSLYVEGYWQTERYFAAVADEIRADFQLAEPMTDMRQAIAAQMSASAVSVHVRRGDYITNANAAAFHGTCSPEWYARAMNHMAENVKDPRFFVFSDDPEWSRANLPSFPQMVFIDPQPDGREFEDIHLMSHCRHHIIANSSFSWWGAWLNPSPDKKVIAPERWFLAEADLTDRVPASWTRM